MCLDGLRTRELGQSPMNVSTTRRVCDTQYANQESNKVERYSKINGKGERVCLKYSKYILFEILENQQWKGRTSSCWPSKPDSAIWLAWPA